MPSAVIHKIEYAVAEANLKIEFVSGKVYIYKQVPEVVYQAMKNAFSKGIFFNDHIKDKYAFERLD